MNKQEQKEEVLKLLADLEWQILTLTIRLEGIGRGKDRYNKSMLKRAIKQLEQRQERLEAILRKLN